MVRLMPGQARDLVEAVIQAAGGDAANLPQPLADIVVKMLEQINNPKHGNDLIDTIASLLIDTSGMGGPVLAGTRLSMLKEAILSPSELAKVNAMEKSVCCGNCGRAIQQGEMVGLFGRGVMCHSCSIPEKIVCQCGAGHEVGTSLAKMVGRLMAKCETCATGKRVPNPDTIELDEPVRVNRYTTPTPPPPQPLYRPLRDVARDQLRAEQAEINRRMRAPAPPTWEQANQPLVGNTNATLGGVPFRDNDGNNR